MSLLLLSQIYDHISDDDGEHGVGSDIKDNEEVPSETPERDNSKNKLESKIKNRKVIRYPSLRKRKKANSKKETTHSQPKNNSSNKQAKAPKRKKSNCTSRSQKFGRNDDESTVPDLTMSLPFTQCKIVFRLEADCDDDDSKMPTVGWERQGKEFIFHDLITHQEMERLERYARKRELSSRPCPKSKMRCLPGGAEMPMSRSSKSESAQGREHWKNGKVSASLRNCPMPQQLSKELKLSPETALSPKLDLANNTKIVLEHSKSDGVDLNTQDKVPVSSYPIVSKSEKMEDAKASGNKIPLPLMFRCPFCLKSFHEAGALVKHLPLHTGKSIKCDVPPTIPDGNANLPRHGNMDSFTNDEEYEGSITSFRDHEPFINPDADPTIREDKIGLTGKLNEELKTTSQDKIPKEKCCKLVLNRCDNLLEHYGLSLSLNRNELVDQNCHPTDLNISGIGASSANGGKRAGVGAHIEAIQSNGPQKSRGSYKCKLCEKLFGWRVDVVAHIRSVHKKNHLINSGLKPQTCGLCSQVFSRQDTLRHHLRTHSEVKLYSYDLCSKTFPRSTQLKRHLVTHSGINAHQCNVCSKAFSRRATLKVHLLTHSGIKPHKCNLCQKTFSQRGTLKGHLLTHSGIKPHKCNLCQKTFSQRGTLKRHLLTHSGLKPHKCSICHKTFSERGTLKRHLLTHSGIKPHKCNICHQTFSERGTLKRHLLTHSGIKPHKCHLCPKTFSQRGTLRRHLRNLH